MKRDPIPVVHISKADDCAYCRKSELAGKKYRCKLNLPMQAKTCAEFRDSRKPSSGAQPFMTEV